MSAKTPRKQPPIAPNAPVLATPCTLLDLRHWLAEIDILGPGADQAATITTTDNQINVG
jgi:hypothetical protein